MSKPIPSTPVAPLPPLADLTEQIQSAHRKIVTQQDKFLAETLPHRLTIGLLCLQAHNIFALPADQRGQGRKKIKSRRDQLETKSTVKKPKSFEDWLETELSWLKKPVAYKYIKAFSGLGLDHTAAPTSIPEALAAWEQANGPATLAALIAANTLQLGKPEKDEPEQTEFDFFKSNASHFREASEIIIGMKETLPEEFRKVICAQIYTTLYELTGTHWAPSNDAPELATIDPAAITI